MSHRHCCVIDAEGLYKTLVLVITKPNMEGHEQEFIEHYRLADGETIIDARAPGGNLCKPRWNGKAWEESATPEEIEAWQLEKDENAPPLPAGPTLPERVGSLEDQMTDTQLALVDTYEQADAANTDVLMATAEVYEKLLALEGRLAVLEGGANANG